MELSAQEILEQGYDFFEIEQKLDDFYKADRFKKKRIYEASNNHPFVAWKLQGEIPFPRPHYFQKYLIFLWNILPAASYPGIKKIDLNITRKCNIWDKMDKNFKEDYKFMFRCLVGLFIWIFALIFTHILCLKHPLIALIICFVSFYFPSKMFK
jgi:hypothetical protein